MTLLQIVILCIFVIAFFAIIVEGRIGFEKFKTSMFFGLLSWVIIWIHGYVSLPEEGFHKIEHAFHEHILEISMLWLFLISAMTFVAYLDKRGWIEKTVIRYLPEQISEKKFLFVIGTFTFLFSGVADNLTATLVALTIVLSVLKTADTFKIITFTVLIVYAANAGGLPLITGDVTTLMIFMAGKISMTELLRLYAPAIATFLVLFVIFSMKMTNIIIIEKSNIERKSIDGQIAVLFILTIIAILLGHVFFHIPPVLTFLLGLSVMFLLIAREKKRTSEEIRVLDYVQHIEFDALFFFLGVLLLVGALKEVGVLGHVAVLYEYLPPELATYFIGITSAIVDNIPITAAMLKADLPLDEKGWMLMTYAVGVGGSLLSIGSAAGVVAMSKVKSLDFNAYLKFTPVIFMVYTLGYVITYFVAGAKKYLKTRVGDSGFFV